MEILYQFHRNQEFMLKFYSPRKSTESIHESVTKHFYYFFSAMLASYAAIVVTFRIYWPDWKLYCVQYVVMTFIIHAQSFQILAYSKLIRFQMKLFNSIATEKLSFKGQEEFRSSLLLIFEFVQKVNNTFSASLLAVMCYVYMSVLSNLHWSFMSLVEMTHLYGESFSSCFLTQKL